MAKAPARWIQRGGGDQVGWGVAVSLGLHLLLLAVLVFWPGWGHSQRQTFVPTYQVNLVGAPKLAPPAPPAPAPAPKPAAKAAPKPEPKKTEPKPAPKPEPKKEAIATKKETAKPKRIQRKPKPKPQPKVNYARELDKKIKRLRSKVDEDRALDSAMERIASRASAAKGSAGAMARGGATADQMSMRFQVYYTQLWEMIRKSWVLPEAMVEKPQGLVAVVVLRIRRDGSLDRLWLEEGSGNARFDASALRAAERAAPFPPLPSGLRERVHEVGVRFKAEDIRG